jgi:UDP-GlcNAc:undecaprenyl-phosphate GlcNAc-1-phosphate transferase
MNDLWLATVHNSALDGFRAPLITGLIAMLVSWFLTPIVRKLAIEKGAVDDPTSDDRRVHTEPTPRWGGLAIYGGIFAAVALVLPFAYKGHELLPPYVFGIGICGACIVVMGALDDLYQYRASIQAAFLLAMGLLVQFFVGNSGHVQIHGIANPIDHSWIDFGWVAYPITAIYLFVVTKTMDTIDGIDGLAAGMAAIAGATLSIIATYFVLKFTGAQAHQLGPTYVELPRIALIAAAIAGAALGFLRHNYNPAKIFMGTGGAQLLGFTLGAISIVGVLKTAAAVALVIPVLAFGVPIFDAFFVVVRRLLSRQPITQADKRHLHHTLLGKGLSQRQTVWVLYLAAMALCFVLLVVVRRYV